MTTRLPPRDQNSSRETFMISGVSVSYRLSKGIDGYTLIARAAPDKAKEVLADIQHTLTKVATYTVANHYEAPDHSAIKLTSVEAFDPSKGGGDVIHDTLVELQGITNPAPEEQPMDYLSGPYAADVAKALAHTLGAKRWPAGSKQAFYDALAKTTKPRERG